MHTFIAWNILTMGAIWATLTMRLASESSELVSEATRSLPGAKWREGVTGHVDVILTHEVAIIDHTVHLCCQQVLIGG